MLIIIIITINKGELINPSKLYVNTLFFCFVIQFEILILLFKKKKKKKIKMVFRADGTFVCFKRRRN